MGDPVLPRGPLKGISHQADGNVSQQVGPAGQSAAGNCWLCEDLDFPVAVPGSVKEKYLAVPLFTSLPCKKNFEDYIAFEQLRISTHPIQILLHPVFTLFSTHASSGISESLQCMVIFHVWPAYLAFEIYYPVIALFYEFSRNTLAVFWTALSFLSAEILSYSSLITTQDRMLHSLKGTQTQKADRTFIPHLPCAKHCVRWFCIYYVIESLNWVKGLAQGNTAIWERRRLGLTAGVWLWAEQYYLV